MLHRSSFLEGVQISTSPAYESSSGHDCPFKAEWQGTAVTAKKLVELLSYTTDAMLVEFCRDLSMLCQLRHPNIVQFFGVCKPFGGRTLQVDSETFLVCELMFCPLDVRNRMKPTLNLRNVVDICLGIANGLHYLHNREPPIIHRDLTTSKVFLSSTGVVKISEICCGRMQAIQWSPDNIYTTDIYTAPELLKGGSFCDTSVDVFSFGVVMLELALGRDGEADEPFRSEHHRGGALVQVSELERRKRDLAELDSHVLKPLVTHCISNRDYRPRASELSRQLFAIKQTQEYRATPLVSVVGSGPTLNQLPLKELSAKCEMLEERVQVLESDKRLLSDKLDGYIRSEHNERENESFPESNSDIKLRLDEVDKLMSENAKLQEALLDKDREIDQLSSFSSPPSSLTDTQMRDQRASLMQKLNELKLSKRLDADHLEKQIRTLKLENSSLKTEIEMLKGVGKSWLKSGIESPSGGPASLPEFSQGSPTTLQSPTSTNISSFSVSHPSLSSHTTSSSSSSTASSMQSRLTASDSAQANAEIKRLKKLMEKYKAANIELDKKLKATKVDLQKHDTQHTDTDVLYRMDVERFRSENQQLRVQLDLALSENSQLRTQLNAAGSRQCY